MTNASRGVFFAIVFSLLCYVTQAGIPVQVVSFPGSVSELVAPNGAAKVVNRDPSGDEGFHSLFILVNGRTEQLIYQYARGVQVSWSPGSQYIFVTDHMGSTNATCLVIDARSGRKIDLLPQAKELGGSVASTLSSPHAYLECQQWRSENEILAKAYGWGTKDSSDKTFELVYALDKGFRVIGTHTDPP